MGYWALKEYNGGKVERCLIFGQYSNNPLDGRNHAKFGCDFTFLVRASHIFPSCGRGCRE